MSNINACTTKTMTDAGAATEGSLPQESMAVPQQPAQTASDVDSSKSGAQEAEMKQGQLDVALVERVREMAVFDSESNQCSFGELIDAKQGEKCLVIFIRCVAQPAKLCARLNIGGEAIDISTAGAFQSLKNNLLPSDAADCSLCQSYLKHLTDVATPQQFADANVRVSVIGHGDSAVIKSVSFSATLSCILRLTGGVAMSVCRGLEAALEDLRPTQQRFA